MFGSHVVKVIRKAKRLKGVIKNVTGGTFNRTEIVKRLWEGLAIPSLLYGVEIFELSKSELEKLQVIEREVGRWALGGNQGVAIEAIYGDLGWITLENRIKERRLNFLGRANGSEGDSWLKQAWDWARGGQLPWAARVIALCEELDIRVGDGSDYWKGSWEALGEPWGGFGLFLKGLGKPWESLGGPWGPFGAI